jgi:hydrogenase-4 component B
MTPTALLLAGILLLLVGGALAAAMARVRPLAHALFLASSLGGCALAGLAGVRVLGGAEPGAVRGAWTVPGGLFHLRLDALGAWFAVVVALVAAPIALYSVAYFARAGARTFGSFSIWLSALLAALLTLSAARNALLFLAAWEAMTLSAYLLVTLEHEKEYVRWSGRLYIFANHSAAFCLIALIGILAAGSGSLDIGEFGPSAAPGLCVALALLAFGTKAGVIPFHIWLPHAHPAAASPVSAMLSGIVLKAGIFGILRFLPALAHDGAGWGLLVLVLGAVAGVMGVLYALAQHELKRLLAYHSVENIGIILLGIGVGLMGAHANLPEVAVLGFAGALLHVLNHAAFKSLLFLGAGSVLHGAGTGEIDELGGLAKRMPVTALCFLVGSVSICGLPPFNGFVSEWTIYRAMFLDARGGAGAGRLAGAMGIVSLALVGGLAAACFAKAFAAVFLGEPRGHDAIEAHEARPSQRVAMAFLALLCLAIGLLPHVVLGIVWPAAAALAGGVGVSDVPAVGRFAPWYAAVSGVGALFVGLALVLALVRRGLARGPRPVATWGCGYALPGPRMQYTASSFAASLLRIFRGLVHPTTRLRRAEGAFPPAPSLLTWTKDAAETYVFRPAFVALAWPGRVTRLLHRVAVQYQVLFVIVALAALLLWKVTLG